MGSLARVKWFLGICRPAPLLWIKEDKMITTIVMTLSGLWEAQSGENKNAMLIWKGVVTNMALMLDFMLFRLVWKLGS